MRGFTRLNDGFSWKVENLASVVAIHYMRYNFCGTHKTLRVMPAMAAGVSDHAWGIAEIAELLDTRSNEAAT